MADQYDELEKLVLEGKFAVAEPRVLDWLQYHPNDARAWLLYGKCVTNPAQKKNCFKRAFDLDPSSLEARELLEQFGTTNLQPPPTKEQSGADTHSLPISSPLPIKPSSSFVISESPVMNKQAKRRLPAILYSLFHFLLTLLFGIILVFLFSLFVPGLLDFNKPDNAIQRNWLSNETPSEDYEEFQLGASVFLNPSRLDYREVDNYQGLKTLRTSILDDSSEPSSIEFNGVSFVGQLVGGNVLQRGENEKPVVVVMDVVFDETRIPVVYYGPTDNFEYDDRVLVEGVYIEETNAISAQRVEKVSTNSSIQIDDDQMLILRVAGGVLLWALFCFSVFFWRVNLRRWQRDIAVSPPFVNVLFFLLSISLLISGCTIDLSTTLRPDGTGITSILVRESRENMDFLRSSPGVAGYLSAVVREVRSSGVLFEQYVEGDQEVFLIQRYFNNSSTGTGDSYPLVGSWIYVQRYREENEEVMRFLGVVDTRTLYNSSDEIDPNVAGLLRDQLNQIDMNYHLVIPGNLIFHNGDEATGQNVSWRIRMNDINFLIAEARFPVEGEADVKSYERYIWIVLGVIFVVSTLFLIGSIWVRSPASNRIGRKP